MDAPYWPVGFESTQRRALPFGATLYIERSDFQAVPEKGFRRLTLGGEVRLRHAYFIKCNEVITDEQGTIVELKCTYDNQTKGGQAPDGRKVKGTIHWVSAHSAIDADVRLYDRLYTAEFPGRRTGNFLDDLNPESMRTLTGCKIEPSVAQDTDDTRYQFERNGYFWRDAVESKPHALVFNRIIALRDSWQKSKAEAKPAPIEPVATARSSKADTRPNRRTAAQIREANRQENETLAAKYSHFMTALGLSAEAADLLTADESLTAAFEAAVRTFDDAETVAKWFVNVLLGELKERALHETRADGKALGVLVKRVSENVISSSAGKTVLAVLLETGGDVDGHIQQLGLAQVSDEAALTQTIDEIIEAFPEKVDAYRNGRTGLFGFFVGQCMKATGGRADPQVLKALLKDRLG
ncbi:MAG: hypothetical protein VX589_19815 [Myxococcota bacterium]|nr:hypothetical protein [Myxococcota bacterium]